MSFCEWKARNSLGTSCEGNEYPVHLRYCPDCGKEVVKAAKTCTISGEEFPYPAQERGEWTVRLIVAKVSQTKRSDEEEFYSEHGAHQLRKALLAAVRFAKETAQ